MKKSMFCFFLVFPAFWASGQQRTELRPFFSSLRAAAESKDVPNLKTLIFPFRDQVEDMQAGMIERILNGDEDSRGDGAFSMRALDSLLANHLDKISVIDKDLYRQLSRDIIFGKAIGRFRQKDVLVMDHRDARIILLQGKGGLQLFFWENLNNLLRP